MSAEEMTEWMIYHSIEPFGALRSDIQAGTIAAVVANVHRDPKRQRKPFKVTDFMIDLTGDRKRADFAAQMRAFAKAMKARNERLKAEAEAEASGG